MAQTRATNNFIILGRLWSMPTRLIWVRCQHEFHTMAIHRKAILINLSPSLDDKKMTLLLLLRFTQTQWKKKPQSLMLFFISNTPWRCDYSHRRHIICDVEYLHFYKANQIYWQIWEKNGLHFNRVPIFLFTIQRQICVFGGGSILNGYLFACFSYLEYWSWSKKYTTISIVEPSNGIHWTSFGNRYCF